MIEILGNIMFWIVVLAVCVIVVGLAIYVVLSVIEKVKEILDEEE